MRDVKENTAVELSSFFLKNGYNRLLNPGQYYCYLKCVFTHAEYEKGSL